MANKPKTPTQRETPTKLSRSDRAALQRVVRDVLDKSSELSELADRLAQEAMLVASFDDQGRRRPVAEYRAFVDEAVTIAIERGLPRALRAVTKTEISNDYIERFARYGME